MYVPANPENPTWDETYRVSFRQWLTSSRKDRQEWFQLRQAAARTQHLVWQAEDRERADRIGRRIAGPQPVQPVQQPQPPRATRPRRQPRRIAEPRQQARRPSRSRRARPGWLSLDGLELLLLVLPVLAFIVCVGAVAIWHFTR